MSVARLDDNQEKDPRAGSSGKQISADLPKSHVSPGLMLPQPTPFNREGKPCAVFGRAAAMAEKKRAVEQLDLNPQVLHWLHGAGDLQQFARGF